MYKFFSLKVIKPKIKYLFISFLIIFFLLLIAGGQIRFGQKILAKTGIISLFRKLKLLKISEAGFFKALKDQNLLYDYNNDGIVMGEDYSLMLSEAKDGVMPEIFVTQTGGSKGENPLDRTNLSLPTVKGFSTNEFDGSANVDYPLDLPSSQGGLTPKLALSYSSSSVDDMNVGVHTIFRGSYQRQAGLVGLGWNLSGMSYISRDFNNTMENPTDDKFILSFEGGSANLVKESGDDNYSLWRTTPNLNLKIERYGKCYAVKLFAYPSCRHSWIVTTGDGTKYFFGSDKILPYGQWARGYDPDTINLFTKPNWYPLYEQVNNMKLGTREWITLSESQNKVTYYTALTSKWLLARVESKYYKPGVNDAKIDYQYRFELTTSNQICQQEWNPSYSPLNKYREKGGSVSSDWHTKSVYPYKIIYGKNTVDFTYEDRYDYLLGSYTWICSSSNTAFLQRMKKITISSLGKVRNVYKLDYEYGWKPKDHSTKILWYGSSAAPQVIPNWNNLNCTVEINKANKKSIYRNDLPETADNQPIHSLLVKITEYSDDPQKNPQAKSKPVSKFSYGNNCNDYCGGCPLTSYYDPNKPTEQKQTANDFLLQKADNGSGGSTTFEYWKDVKGGYALPVKYCYNNADGTSSCLKDLTENTQRHRVASKTTTDGMGNSYKVSSNYLSEGATQGLAYVESPFTERCEDKITGKITTNCRPDTIKARCRIIMLGRGGEDCGGKNIEYKSTDLPGYEFLGYPEVETVTYQKNSSTEVAARSKKNYIQAMQTTSCFKTSPLKGVAYKTTAYNTSNSSRFTESLNKYKVRFGKMFEQTTEVADTDLSKQCSIYDPKTTVSLVLSTESISKDYINGTPALCTKSSRDYTKLDGSVDPYAQLRKEITWGKVNCNDTNKDISDGTPIVSIKDYTQGKNDSKWRVPLPNESWTQGYQQTDKYNHSRIYYDSQLFGILGDYGNITKTETLVNGNVYASSQNTYDTNFPWLLTQTADPMGRITKTEYDTFFHQYPVKVTNSLGQVLKTEYDFTTSDTTHPNYQSSRGLVVKTIDPNNQETNLVYDKFGRLLDTYLAGMKPGRDKPNSSNRIYYFNEADISPCNEANNCMTGLGKQLGGASGPKMAVLKTTRFDNEGTIGRLSTTYSFYNGLGQEVQTRSTWYEGSYSNAGIPVEGEGNKDLVTSKTYNILGNVDLETLPYTDTPYSLSSQNPYLTRDFKNEATIKKITTVYDGLGRPIKITSPDGTYIQTDYDVDSDPLKTKSLSKNCTDSDSSTLCTYALTIKDAFGRTVENQLVDTSNNKTYSTRSEYHPVLGAVTKTFDTLGNVTSIISYDLLGRKNKMWDIDMTPSMTGDNNSWKYEYDILGNLVKQTDPKGQIQEISYDTLNRVTFKKTNGKNILENQYDSCSFGVGKLCKSISYDFILDKPIYTKTSEYDNLGKVKKELVQLSNMTDNVINGLIFIYEYLYDEGGRIITVKNSANNSLNIPDETLTPGYDRPYLKSLTGISNYLKDTKYDKYGKLLTFITGDDTSQKFTYDDNTQRLTSFSLKSLSNSSIAGLSYTYDPNGTITQIIDNVKPVTDSFSLTQNFIYDGFNRLTQVSGAYNASYTYDDLNNILTKQEGTNNVTLNFGTYQDSFYHRPKSVVGSDGKTSNYIYDKLGNLISQSTSSYEYNPDNRMTKSVVSSPSTSSQSYYYTADGQRIAKIDSSTENTYYISPDLEIFVKKDGTASWRKNYYVNGKLIAVKPQNENITYIHSDYLGSSSWMTQLGQLVSEERYYPFGTTRSLNGKLPTERQFTGQISDTSQTGLYYYNARYYDQEIAKFTQPDSINNQQNRYAYVGNNPVNKTDPTGHVSEIPISEYLQTDSKWGNLKTEYGYKFWQIGCGYTVMAMLAATYIDTNINPLDIMNNYVIDANGNGLLGSPELIKSLEKLGFTVKETRVGDFNLKELLSKPDTMGLITVTLNDEKSQPEHWTLITGVNPDGTVNFQDPLYGTMSCSGSLSGSMSCKDQKGKKHSITVNGRWLVNNPKTKKEKVVDPKKETPKEIQTCFPENTKILLSNGLKKNIQDIKPNDLVLSYDLNTGKYQSSKVKELLIHPNNPKGYLVINGHLKITPNHIVWIANKLKWDKVETVNIGDEFLNYQGKKEKVISIKHIEGTYTVYNLHLDMDPHNFFAEGILVHNKKCGANGCP